MESITESVGLVITARVRSSRIKEKVLQKIGGQTAIEILIDHVVSNDNYYSVVLAIPENEDDDKLQEIGDNKGVDVYRGQDDSPLHRLYECAKEHGFDHIVRVTADDILIDQSLLRKQIYRHIKGCNDYTYLSRCPSGIGAEVFKFEALEKIALDNTDPIEFTSYYIKNKGFKCYEFYAPFEYQVPYRFVMDYPEDLLLLRVLFASLHKGFGTLSLIDFVKQHKYFLRINHLPQITFYTCNYNYSNYIIETMKSIIDQDFDDWEYIVIDDNSTDDSMNKIVEFYSGLDYTTQKKIKILRNEKNLGLGASSNRALEMARGQYICRVDADDVIFSDFSSKMIVAIEGSSESKAVISSFVEFEKDIEDGVDVLENHWHPACCIVSVREANEVKYGDDVKYCDGHRFWAKFCEKYNVKYLKDDVLWGYRQHSYQKSKQKDHPLKEA